MRSTKNSSYRAVNAKILSEISSRTKLEESKLLDLMRVLKVSLDSSKAKRLLSVLYVSDPESIVDAYYTYLDNLSRYEHSNPNENIRRFLIFLANSKMRSVSLVEEIVVSVGMYDDIDDEVSMDELTSCIEGMEDED